MSNGKGHNSSCSCECQPTPHFTGCTGLLMHRSLCEIELYSEIHCTKRRFVPQSSTWQSYLHRAWKPGRHTALFRPKWQEIMLVLSLGLFILVLTKIVLVVGLWIWNSSREHALFCNQIGLNPSLWHESNTKHKICSASHKCCTTQVMYAPHPEFQNYLCGHL